MKKDLEQIGLHSSAKEILNQIRSNEWFSKDTDLMKFALSYAIKCKLDQHAGPFTTSHNALSFDKDGKVRDLIQLYFPNEENVYRLAQGLLNQGLVEIGKQFKKDQDFLLESYL